MGKKSKRKSNNKPVCYHGCTKKEFNNCGEYHKILDGWVKSNTEERREVFKTYEHVMVDPTFGCFVIAHIADDYLKGKDDGMLRLLFLLLLRYEVVPRHEGKDVDSHESEHMRNYNKYARDILTERGRINCMAREIPCDCMEEKRIEAKSMEKVAWCFQCGHEFLKEKMLRCKGCHCVQYCSTECSIKDWPDHKEMCKNLGETSDADVNVYAEEKEKV